METKCPNGIANLWYRLKITSLEDVPLSLSLVEAWSREGRTQAKAYRYFTTPLSRLEGLQIIYRRYKQSIFIKCLADDLENLLELLEKRGVKCSMFKENATHREKMYVEAELNALGWLLDHAPFFIIEKEMPGRLRRATITLDGSPTLCGYVKKLSKDTLHDRFWINLADELLISFHIPKGAAAPIKKGDAGRNREYLKFDGTRWFVLARLSGREIRVMNALQKWAAAKNLLLKEPISLETYLPLEDKEVSAKNEERSKNWDRNGVLWLTMHKRLVISGYLFVRVNELFLKELEAETKPIMNLWLRLNLLRRDGIPASVPDVVMDSFRNTLKEDMIQLDLTDSSYTEGDYVVYRGSEERPHLKGFIGRIIKKKGALYLAFDPLGGLMNSCKAIEVNSRQIRMLTKAERKKWGIE